MHMFRITLNRCSSAGQFNCIKANRLLFVGIIKIFNKSCQNIKQLEIKNKTKQRPRLHRGLWSTVACIFFSLFVFFALLFQFFYIFTTFNQYLYNSDQECLRNLCCYKYAYFVQWTKGHLRTCQVPWCLDVPPQRWRGVLRVIRCSGRSCPPNPHPPGGSRSLRLPPQRVPPETPLWCAWEVIARTAAPPPRSTQSWIRPDLQQNWLAGQFWYWQLLPH